MSIFDRVRQMAAQNPVDLDEAIANVRKWREEAEAVQGEKFEKQIAEHRSKEIIGRCGILPLHQQCTVENYQVENEGQRIARDFSADFIERFKFKSVGGFYFCGDTGTGKNHLAAAICNALMAENYSCLIITVTELMQKMRNCYSDKSKVTEDEFIQSIVKFDFLVLDEIGLQRGSEAEMLTINQIIDQRMLQLKPTGILTNLSPTDLNDFLGKRIIDRMKVNGGKWIVFDWESYRK